MKILNEKIKDATIIKETHEIIEIALSEGELYTVKKQHPNGYIKLSPGEDKYNISCWGTIFSENDEFLGRFSISDKQLTTSNVQIIKLES